MLFYIFCHEVMRSCFYLLANFLQFCTCCYHMLSGGPTTSPKPPKMGCVPHGGWWPQGTCPTCPFSNPALYVCLPCIVLPRCFKPSVVWDFINPVRLRTNLLNSARPAPIRKNRAGGSRLLQIKGARSFRVKKGGSLSSIRRAGSLKSTKMSRQDSESENEEGLLSQSRDTVTDIGNNTVTTDLRFPTPYPNLDH